MKAHRQVALEMTKEPPTTGPRMAPMPQQKPVPVMCWGSPSADQ